MDQQGRERIPRFGPQDAGGLRLGTAVANIYTRGPALLAMSAATLAGLAPGRFVLGIGVSSPAVVTDWNGIALDRPYQRARDTLHFLRRALAGEKVSMEGRPSPSTASGWTRPRSRRPRSRWPRCGRG